MPKKSHGKNPKGAAFDRRQAARARKTAQRRQGWGDGENTYQVSSGRGCLVSALNVGLTVGGALAAWKGWH